jgi:DNA-binding CsgD family transcriptional regulator
MGTSRRTRPGPPQQGDPVTPREREILELVAGGERTTVTAARVGITENTVKSHCTSAYTKIGARNRVDAARYYLASVAPAPAPAPIAAGAGDLDQRPRSVHKVGCWTGAGLGAVLRRSGR